MMRIVNTFACICVGIDCFGKASGTVEQFLLSPPNLWVWSIASVGWCIYALINLLMPAQ